MNIDLIHTFNIKAFVSQKHGGNDDDGGSATAAVWKDRKLPGLKIPMELSSEMSAFCGEEYLSRPDVIKKLWAHIHENNLQDNEDKRKINLDAKLRSLVGDAGEETINMFDLQKRVGKHLKTKAPDSIVEAATKQWNDEMRVKPPKARAKKTSVGKSKASNAGSASAASKSGDKKPKKKAPKGSVPPSIKGVHKPMELSPELQVVVREAHLSRPQVVKGIWTYIKEHNLQDQENKRVINCDDALKALFEQDSVKMFEMSKLVAKHLVSPSPPEEAARILAESTVAWRKEFPEFAAAHDRKTGAGAATGGGGDASSDAGDDDDDE